MRTQTILARLGCQHLSLHNGGGYWYFRYDDGDAHETRSVMVMRLKDMSLEGWLYEGRALLEQVTEGP